MKISYDQLLFVEETDNKYLRFKSFKSGSFDEKSFKYIIASEIQDESDLKMINPIKGIETWMICFYIFNDILILFCSEIINL